MNFIRVKTSLDPVCTQDRLQYDPEIVELHLEERSLKEPARLISTIRLLKDRGIDVYLHHPSKINGKYLDILSEDPEVKSYYVESSRLLAQICRDEQVRCVIHAHYAKTESSKNLDMEALRNMREEIEKINNLPGGEHFLWEDTIEGLFSYGDVHLIDEIIKPLQLDVNVDISHAFISLRGSNERLKQVLDNTKEYAKYFHVVDSMGKTHDGLPLGRGRIDWSMVKPYVYNKPFIFEIGLKEPHNDCTPMIESAEYFKRV